MISFTDKPSEAWVIAALLERFDDLAKIKTLDRNHINVPMAALDDCAVIDVNKPGQLVIGSDYIRGRQFDLFQLGYLNYFDLGYYLIAANLSDIAAMGAIPIGSTLILRYPDDMIKAEIIQLIDGIATACASNGPCPLLGGDSGGATDLVLSATMLGQVIGKPLLRSNAISGDRVYVIGYPGRAVAADLTVKHGKQNTNGLASGELETLLQQWKRPKPLLDEGQILSSSGYRIACQDTSDGLKSTLYQLAKASKVDIVIREGDFQVEPLLAYVAKLHTIDPLELFFSASVDFCLLFTLPSEIEVKNLFSELHNPPLFYLGDVIQGYGQIFFEKESGNRTNALPGKEYQH